MRFLLVKMIFNMRVSCGVELIVAIFYLTECVSIRKLVMPNQSNVHKQFAQRRQFLCDLNSGAYLQRFDAAI